MAAAPKRKKTKAEARQSRPKSIGVGADSLELRLGFLMHDVSRHRRKAFDHFMKPLGVTRSQWWVLAHLARHDGMMQTDLATQLDVGKVTLGGLVDRLEAGGFVIRKPDPEDRRVKRGYLSGASQALLQQMRTAESELNERVLLGVSTEERDQLITLLSRIKTNMIAVSDDDGSGDDED